MQGTVDEGSVATLDGVTDFTISFNGVTVPVHYSGQPGGIFKECEPVVVHGELVRDGVFAGDDVEVKHSNEYDGREPRPGRRRPTTGRRRDAGSGP